ncbi:MAG: DUF58 domain-containing protein [Deltaproteobacteria bacterium]|nr:MAG: DUF58 domain-containing protein [Deltaproteobacteria bacterium]
MLSREIIKKIEKIHIHTNYLVNDVFAGEYESAFRGRGMEFEEVREYTPGDEIRSIDWNVTARMGRPYVKEFREERELTVMLLIDVSSSGLFGTVKAFKNEVAAEVGAILAFAAVKSNDKVGLIIFTDTVERFIPPEKGRSHVWRVIKEVIGFKPQKKNTDIKMALEFLNRVLNRRAVCFLISDFISEGYEKTLRITSKKHDLIAVTITDPRERELPRVGFIELEDAETGETILIDTSDETLRKGFRQMSEEKIKKRNELFRSMGVDYIDIQTDRPLIDPIMRFFLLRARRL